MNTAHHVLDRHDARPAIPEVVEVAVKGIQDGILGEEVKPLLFSRCEAKITRIDVRDHCRRVMPPYALPRESAFLAALQKPSTGKCDERRLRSREASDLP